MSSQLPHRPRAVLVGVMRRLGGARDVGARAGARERAPVREQPIDGSVVVRAALALAVGRERAAAIRALVPVDAQPGEVVGAAFVVELELLRGRDRLTGVPVDALLTY